MQKSIKNLTYILAISLGFLTTQAYAAKFIEGIRWVKIFSSSLDTNIGVMVNVVGLDSEKYSCGDKCQLIKLMTTYSSDHGDLVINLHNSRCATSTSVNIPFAMDYEDLNTPVMAYTLSLSGGYCAKQQIIADVTGNPDSVFGYKIQLIS